MKNYNSFKKFGEAAADFPLSTYTNTLHAFMLSCFSCVQLFVTLWPQTTRLLCPWGILQARILEWVAIPSSRVSSQPRDQTCVPHISGIGWQVLYHQCHLGSPHKYITLTGSRAHSDFPQQNICTCLLPRKPSTTLFPIGKLLQTSVMCSLRSFTNNISTTLLDTVRMSILIFQLRK